MASHRGPSRQLRPRKVIPGRGKATSGGFGRQPRVKAGRLCALREHDTPTSASRKRRLEAKSEERGMNKGLTLLPRGFLFQNLFSFQQPHPGHQQQRQAED